MKYIIGLGNPGQEYVHTRHNIGFRAVTLLHDAFLFSDWKKDSYMNSLVSVGEIHNEMYTLVLPQTFMNNSGEVIHELQKRGVAISEEVIVVYDDLAFPFMKMRLAYDKGDAGHNGIKSIKNVIGNESFLRIRIGIHSYIPNTQELVSLDRRVGFVLENFRKDEESHIENTLKSSIQKIIVMIQEYGKDKAMTYINAL